MARRIADLQNDFLEDELYDKDDKPSKKVSDTVAIDKNTNENKRLEKDKFTKDGLTEDKFTKDELTKDELTEDGFMEDALEDTLEEDDFEEDDFDVETLDADADQGKKTVNSDSDEFDENGDYKKKKKVHAVYPVILLILVLCNLGLLLGLLWQREQMKQEEEVMASEEALLYTPEEVEEMLENERAALEAKGDSGKQEVLAEIKSTLESGNNLSGLFRSLYKDDIVVYSKGQYHFVPIDKSLKMNEYTMDNIERLPSGEYLYKSGDEVVSHKGIDVSKHQGAIDWAQVAEDGVEFAFLRVGFRGYGKEGKLVLDDTFEDNIKGAKAAGIKVGVYMYTQALNEEELLEEAQLVLDTIAPYRVDCPVVYDVEMVDGNGRMNSLDIQTRTDLTILFCETMKKAGYKPMIYHNMEMGALKLDLTRLEEYDKWFAYYNKDMYYPYAFKIWQYSAKGSVKGIKGEVDMNIAFEPVWE